MKVYKRDTLANIFITIHNISRQLHILSSIGANIPILVTFCIQNGPFLIRRVKKETPRENSSFTLDI